MGIPLINAICLLVAYQKLKIFKMTSWDRDNHFQVFHRPISKFRLGFAAFIAVFGLLFYFQQKKIERTTGVKRYATSTFDISSNRGCCSQWIDLFFEVQLR